MALILAVDDNLVNLKVVSATMQHAGFEVAVAINGLEALELAKQVKPDLVILDIDMPEMDGYEVCRRLRKLPVTANKPIMMLTAHEDLEEKIKGFEAGADDYLTKPFQPAELQARVKVLLKRISQSQGADVATLQNKTLGIFSLRGGVGVSTIASNIAVGLAQLWGETVVLVDMVMTMGQSALMLNLSLRNTWADLGTIPADELEEDLIDNVLLKHESGVSVLAAPRGADEGELIQPENVKRVLELLKRKYSYIVLDLPHNFCEITLSGLDLANQIVAVMSPDLASVRAMVGARQVFQKLGYRDEAITVLLNWVFERRGLARKDIENVVKLPLKMVIPFASDTFVSAINLGVPPVLSSKDSPIGALFEDFAFSFSKEEDQKKRPKEPTECWKRVNERMIARQQARR